MRLGLGQPLSAPSTFGVFYPGLMAFTPLQAQLHKGCQALW